jgi:hypothetical protein
MNLDIDGLIQATNPWEFIVTVGGKDYPTRRPSVGELGAFSTLSTMSPDVMAATIGNLFADPKPDTSAWSAHQLTAFLAGYLAYFNTRIESEKKLDTVAQAARSTVAELAKIKPMAEPV